MNKLVERLREDNFPLIFRLNDLEGLFIDKDENKILINEAINKKWINSVYNDIYTLEYKYRKIIVNENIIAQMIDPDSYISMYYVLCEYQWIPEYIFSVTSVTKNNSCKIETDEFGTFIYKKLYNKIPNKGVYEEKEKYGNYKIATPLRALCDLMYFKNRPLFNLDSLYEILRIDCESLREDLKSEDFEELQGAFEIDSLEDSLKCIRRELKL